MQEESASTWHFMMGWMTVFNTRQVASWQLEVATGKRDSVCRALEAMDRHPHCWQQPKTKHQMKDRHRHTVGRHTAERRPRKRDKLYSALWHLVPPVPSFE